MNRRLEEGREGGREEKGTLLRGEKEERERKREGGKNEEVRRWGRKVPSTRCIMSSGERSTRGRANSRLCFLSEREKRGRREG